MPQRKSRSPDSASQARLANKALIDKLISPQTSKPSTPPSESGDANSSHPGFSDEWLERAQRLFTKEKEKKPDGSHSPSDGPPGASPDATPPQSPSPKSSEGTESASALRKQASALQAQLKASKSSEQLAKDQVRGLEQKLLVAEQAKTKWSTYAGKMVQERKDALDMCELLRKDLQKSQQQLADAGIDTTDPPASLQSASGGNDQEEDAAEASVSSFEDKFDPKRLAAAEAEMVRLTELYEKTRGELATAETALAGVIADKSSLEQANKIMETSEAKLQRTLAQLGDDYVAVEEAKNKAEAALKASQAEVTKLQERCGELETAGGVAGAKSPATTKEDLKAKYSKTAAMQGKMKERFDKELAQCRAEAAEEQQALAAELQELKGQLAEQQGAASTDFEARLSAVQESKQIVLRALETAKEELEQSQHTVSDLEEDNTRLRARADEAESVQAELQKELDEASAGGQHPQSPDETRSLRAEVQQLQQLNLELRREKAELQQQAEASQKEAPAGILSSLRASQGGETPAAPSSPGPRLVELRAQLEHTRAELKAANEQRAQDESKLFEALENEAELAALKEASEGLKAEHKEEVRVLKVQLKKSGAELKQAKEAAKAHSEELKDLTKELGDASSGSAGSTKELAGLKAELRKLRAELKAARADLSSAVGRCKAAEEESSVALESLKELKRQKGALETKLGSANRQISQRVAELKERDSQIKLYQEKAEMSDARLKQAHRTPSPKKSKLGSSTAKSPRPADLAQREQMLTRVFQLFDLDRSGSIDVDELKQIGVQRRLLGHKQGEWTEEKNERLVKRLDSDGDGRVIQEEFVQYYLKLHSKCALPDFVEVVGQYMEVASCLYLERQHVGAPGEDDAAIRLKKEQQLRRDSQAAALLVQAELDEVSRMNSNLEKMVSSQRGRVNDCEEMYKQQRQQYDLEVAELRSRLVAQTDAIPENVDAIRAEVERETRARERWRHVARSVHTWLTLVNSNSELLNQLEQRLLEVDAERQLAEERLALVQMEAEGLQREKAQQESEMRQTPADATLQRVALKLAEELQRNRQQMEELKIKLAERGSPAGAGNPVQTMLSPGLDAQSKREYLEQMFKPPITQVASQSYWGSRSPPPRFSPPMAHSWHHAN